MGSVAVPSPRHGARPWLAAGAGGALGLGVALLADADRRARATRTARVWRLTARRGASWALHRARRRGVSQEERARLDESFAIRSAEDVARELGNMKGAVMKVGQMVSFIAEGLPPEAQSALTSLQADVPAMAPSLAEGVVEQELGAPPSRLFLDWERVPVAAASIGQVHRAVLPDGRRVAVKVQYPGIDRAIGSDLDNAELLYGLLASVSLKGLDARGLVDELRARMGDELDYRVEAANQAEFARLYRHHPFAHVPEVVTERSSSRVLTSEWVGGRRWEEFLERSDRAGRQRAAEVLFRFAQRSVHRHGAFNGDPHPGNYRFHPDGSVTFLDFGLVKRLAPGELGGLGPVLDAMLGRDAHATADRMVQAGFLAPDQGLDHELVWQYVSGPYQPYLEDEFTYTRAWVGRTLSASVDVRGPYAEVVRRLNLPPSFVILDRLAWGLSALLGRLEARGRWRDMLAEYRHGAAPSTDLGRMEAEWEALHRSCAHG